MDRVVALICVVAALSAGCFGGAPEGALEPTEVDDPEPGRELPPPAEAPAFASTPEDPRVRAMRERQHDLGPSDLLVFDVNGTVGLSLYVGAEDDLPWIRRAGPGDVAIVLYPDPIDYPWDATCGPLLSTVRTATHEGWTPGTNWTLSPGFYRLILSAEDAEVHLRFTDDAAKRMHPEVVPLDLHPVWLAATDWSDDDGGVTSASFSLPFDTPGPAVAWFQGSMEPRVGAGENRIWSEVRDPDRKLCYGYERSRSFAFAPLGLQWGGYAHIQGRVNAPYSGTWTLAGGYSWTVGADVERQVSLVMMPIPDY